MINITLDKNEVLIIGGGTTGLYFANCLLEASLDVCIVESGDEGIRSFNNSEFKSVGIKHSGLSIGRCKGFGGTSNLWGGQMVEFAEDDFRINSFDQPLWPLSYSDILPYYEKVRKKLNVPKIEPFNDYYKKLSDVGGISPVFTNWLKTPNMKTLYYKSISISYNSTLLSDLTVIDLIFKSNKVTQIVCLNANSEIVNIKGFSKLVLANGTIEISRLLLNAKLNSTNPLTENRFIGQYIQDHFDIEIGIIKPESNFYKYFTNGFIDGNKFQVKLINDSSSNKDYLSITTFFDLSIGQGGHLLLLKQFFKSVLGWGNEKINFRVKDFFKFSKFTIAAVPLLVKIIYTYILHKRVFVPKNSDIRVCIQSQQISIPNSCITLVHDTTLYKPVSLNWQLDGREFENIHGFVSDLQTFFSENNLGEFKPHRIFDNKIINNTETIEDRIKDTYHIAGGSIMGLSIETSVVDADCKVHNTDNLYILGSAVFPTSSSVNTGMTMFAFAERLAAHLARK